jgi:hypothetical protein
MRTPRTPYGAGVRIDELELAAFRDDPPTVDVDLLELARTAQAADARRDRQPCNAAIESWATDARAQSYARRQRDRRRQRLEETAVALILALTAVALIVAWLLSAPH